MFRKRKFFRKRGKGRFSQRRMRRSYRKMKHGLPRVLPERFTCRLRYVQEFSLNNESLGTVCQAFSANNCWDPDTTGVGHQPMGFDTLTSYYNHFTVIGSKITLRPIMKELSNANPAYWGVALCATDTQITGYSASQLFENERVTRPRTWGNLNNMINMGAKAVSNFSLKKFFNVSTIDSERFQSTSSAGPTEQAYFVCYATEVYDNDPGTLYFIATIDYIVVCHEPKAGVASLSTHPGFKKLTSDVNVAPPEQKPAKKKITQR